MAECGKGCMPECRYFTTGGCVSPFNCMYKEESVYINSATSGTVIYTGGMNMTNEEMIENLKCVIADISKQCEELQAENASLRERLDNAVELPCKIGDKVYMPWVYDGISGIAEITAMSITIFDGEFICDTDLASDDINFKQEYSYGQFRDFDFGTKVFTTRKAAESRLAELKGEKK